MAAKKRKSPPIASAAKVNALITEICAAHGFRRTEFSPGRHATVGLRGPAGQLACSLMTAISIIARTRHLPTFKKASES